jgi:hypothetical protein
MGNTFETWMPNSIIETETFLWPTKGETESVIIAGQVQALNIKYVL